MRRPWFALASAAALSFAAASQAAAQTPAGPVPPAPPVASVSQPPPSAAVRDPYEHFNRQSYRFTRQVDAVLLRPGAVFYHHALPHQFRGGVHNMIVNLNHPIIFVNDVLQLRPKAAATTIGRFAINSVIGVGGMFDVASRAGLNYHSSDFGQTLARYGVAAGPYVFIPILGPSTVRDAFGRGFDAVAEPFNWIRFDGDWQLAVSRAVVGGLDARDLAEPILKGIDRTATDPYVTVRSLYLQSRDADIRGAAATEKSVQALPDIGPSPSASPTTRPPLSPSEPVTVPPNAAPPPGEAAELSAPELSASDALVAQAPPAPQPADGDAASPQLRPSL